MSIGADDDTAPIGLPRPIPPGDAPWVGPCVSGMPCGKGVFVRHVKHGGDPDLFAKRLSWLGMRWVMIQCIWQEPDRDVVSNMSRYPEYAAACRARGIEVYAFGWVRPDRWSRFVSTIMHGVHQLAARGTIINPEHPWQGNHYRAARELMDALKHTHGPERTVGVTTYGGGPGWIESFPFEQFAAADFVIPQYYDTRHRLPPTYPVRATKRYLAAGYKNIVPALGAGNKHTPADMVEHFNETPLPISAVCWWDLYWILLSHQRARVVRDLEVPGLPPGGGEVA